MITTKFFIKTALTSLLIFLSVCWTAAFNHGYGVHVTEALVFLAFTWYWCWKHQTVGNSTTMTVLAIMLGRFILESGVRTIDFYKSIGSLGISLICLMGILAGAVCYKFENIYIRLACIYFIIILAFVGGDCWDYYVIKILQPDEGYVYRGLLFRQ